jgi:serine/threonine protein phosphatase 1
MHMLDCNRFNIFLSEWKPSPGRLDPGTVVCAIGDVHGQLGHLSALVAWLGTNVLCDSVLFSHLITLGDYVDRGPHGIGVLDYLGRLQLPGVDIVRLRGNHDVFLERFLYDPACDFDFLEEWIDDGATSTFRELGFTIDALYRYPFDGLRAKVLERIGEAGLRCLGTLRLARRIGSYVFVHAGVHPTKPLDLDDAGTLTWIRDPFLSAAQWPHDFVVVHGHTPCGPEVKQHRIACDSGAFYSDVLTCAELQDDAVRFIAVTSAVNVGALDRNLYRSSSRGEKWLRVQ